MENLTLTRDEIFHSIYSKNIKQFKKTFLTFDSYYYDLDQAKNNRHHLKECASLYQEIQSFIIAQKLPEFFKILLTSKNNIINIPQKLDQNVTISHIFKTLTILTDFFDSKMIDVFLSHLQDLENKHKVNLLLVAFTFMFSKDLKDLPHNYFETSLMKFKMPYAHYFYLIQMCIDFFKDSFMETPETSKKLSYIFKVIDPKFTDKVIYQVGIMCALRDCLFLYKSLEKSFEYFTPEHKGQQFTFEHLKNALITLFQKNNDMKGIYFVLKTASTGETSTITDY